MQGGFSKFGLGNKYYLKLTNLTFEWQLRFDHHLTSEYMFYDIGIVILDILFGF